jgi:membrane associated rhomboid family serine protease
MDLLNRLERKFRKYAIKDLMKYIAIGNAIIYLFIFMLKIDLYTPLVLIPQLVAQGEFWRLFTFVFVPESSGLLTLLYLYFLYYIGTTLENEWGSFKFNIFYILGVIGCIVGSFLTQGLGTPFYLNMSLFLAFAYLFPDFEFRLFFFIPMKMKYLGYFYAVLILIQFFGGDSTTKVLITLSLINFLIFFGKDIYYRIIHKGKSTIRKKQYYNKVRDHRVIKTSFHKCSICGKTELDNKMLEFRYCSKCNGDYEYCSEHLVNHEHVKQVEH